MTNRQNETGALVQSLRLWPGVAIAVVILLIRFVIPYFVPEFMMYGALAGLLGGLLVMLWWVFFSRAPRADRWGGTLFMIAALFGTHFLLHESVATSGMGMMYLIYALPILSMAFVVWAVACRGLPEGPRRVTMVATILLSCGVWIMLRTDGVTGEGSAELSWRWVPSSEEQFLAKTDNGPTASADSPTLVIEADWAGFRGSARNGIVTGLQIETDWSASPPQELWRREMGPSWSSFAVGGDFLYTQEQRGENEVVLCYKVSTGEPVWRHDDAARFWESMAGAGPRATPTLNKGRIYSLGATGIVNALDAGTGSLVWTRNAATDTGAELPIWAYSGSPLVVDDLVIVAASGSLVAYDAASGEPRWTGPKGTVSYSSPQLLTIDGVAQILLSRGSGVSSLAPADGKLLWEHAYPGEPIVQPALTADGDVLVSAGQGKGLRCLSVTHGSGEWQVTERWTASGFKPYFNDYSVHKNHAFGYDGSILACTNLEDGTRKWKGGRYGGQLILLADQDLLLILSERGDLVLVSAKTDQLTEVARVPAIKGKTWNHPVLVGDILLVRNGQEMAAFRLSLAEGSREVSTRASKR